jgi:hypothetical protein
VILLERIRRLLKKKNREIKRVDVQDIFLDNVIVKIGKETFTLTLADISMQGMFLYSQKSLHNGDKVQIQFSLPSFKTPLEIEGEIIRVARMHKINDKMNKGVAIRFENFLGESEEVLKSFLETFKPDSNFMSYYL